MAKTPVLTINCNCSGNFSCKGSFTQNIPIDMVVNAPVTKVLLSKDEIMKNGLEYVGFGLSIQTPVSAKTHTL